MSTLEDRTPLLEKSHAAQFLHSTFSPAWITIMAMVAQTILCGLTWGFAGVMAINNTIALPDNLANWVQRNPSDTNMFITVTSTVLGMTLSSLLGITVKHALTFRLPRGVHLSIVAAWIQFSRNALFFRPHRHPGWTLLSGLWVGIIGLLTAAWSNLLTPVPIVQEFQVAGEELNFLSSALSDYVLNNFEMPFVSPTTRNYSLTPDDLGFLGSNTDYLSQAGRSAAMVSLNPGYPAFITQYYSSSGGTNPTTPQYQVSPLSTPPQNYQGLSTSYTLMQQGYTANVSCKTTSSPTITLNDPSPAEQTFETPSGPFNYTLQTWSWSTNCSGNGEYYTGEVNLLTGNGGSNRGSIGNGLFATSVCFYQDFSGPSNQSFLVVMQSPSNSGYNSSYSVADPGLPTVCEVTPMVSTVQVQYNNSGTTVNVSSVLDRTLLPNDSWPLASTQGFVIWAAYFFAQGPYSNTFADDPPNVVQMMTYLPQGSDVLPALEQYLRGIFEYWASAIRASLTPLISPNGEPLPGNMTIPISGTMNVQTVGWKSYPQTHGISLAVITLVTMATIASGIYALREGHHQNTAHGTLKKRSSPPRFDPTSLMDVLVASSMGSLANALSECDVGQTQVEQTHYYVQQRREKLTVKLVTNGGQPILNASADVPHDPGQAELASGM